MKLSIRTKVTLMIIVFAVILILTSLILCGRVMTKTIDTQYRIRSTDLVKTVAQVIDVDQFVRVRDSILEIYNNTENKVVSDEWGSDEFNEYIARFSEIEKTEDFLALRDYVRKIQDANSVDCIYLSTVDYERGYVMYIVDAAHEDACPPGCIDPIYEVNRRVLTNPEYGFPSYITNTEEYGWLITSGEPLYDGNGKVVGYAFVDISMDAIRQSQLDYTLRLLLFLTITMVVISILSIIYVNKTLIKPLKMLSDSAMQYCSDDDSAYHNGFATLMVKTKDEIGALADSMKQMERDINEHISKLLSVNTELNISKHVANEMTELATKDALTGVRNKTSYDNEVKELDDEIRNGKAEFGMAMIDLNFLKHTNDTYGHENGDISIVTLSETICEVFVHSDVFRVGGDEFVAVLKKEDYGNAETLVETFKNKIDEIYHNTKLQPCERISAAIGYSSYDPSNDESVADVFNRADMKMYECKREMKSHGIHPHTHK